MKLKIGNFARIGQVTVQTLRHYDLLGLLKPTEVDTLSGYRYYALDQLPRLNRILALKDLGFSLDQIGQLLKDDLPLTELRGMLRLKQNEIRQQVDEGLDRLERLEARLSLIEKEEQQLDYDVVIKPVEALQVAFVRSVIPSYWEIRPLWEQLYHQLQQADLDMRGPNLALYHTAEPEIDAEVCTPVPIDDKKVKSLTIRELPAVETMASTIHKGSYSGLAGAYAALLKWVDANGYRINGPDREIYLRLPEYGQHGQNENAITEMQVPITKD